MRVVFWRLPLGLHASAAVRTAGYLLGMGIAASRSVGISTLPLPANRLRPYVQGVACIFFLFAGILLGGCVGGAAVGRRASVCLGRSRYPIGGRSWLSCRRPMKTVFVLLLMSSRCSRPDAIVPRHISLAWYKERGNASWLRWCYTVVNAGERWRIDGTAQASPWHYQSSRFRLRAVGAGAQYSSQRLCAQKRR